MTINGTQKKFSFFPKNISFEGKCTIKAYDRNTLSEKNPYTLEIKNNKITSINNQLPLSSDYLKYSLFNVIAGMDGKINDITMKDLAKLRQTFRNENKNAFLKALGVTAVKYDGNLGLGTIEIAGNEIITIDFETKAELDKNKPAINPEARINSNEKSKLYVSENQELKISDETDCQETESAKIQENRENFVSDTKNKTSNPAKHYYDRSNTEIPSLYKVKLKKVAKKMNISEKNLQKRISRAAEKTGYSEYFIKHVISMEDFISKVKDTGDGTITGGFGHTGLKDKGLKKGDDVTADIAFEWLVSDIKYFENKIKNMKIEPGSEETMESYFNALPLSMREAMIDVAYNRDASKIENSDEYAKLRLNIKAGAGYLPACAVRLRQNFNQYTFKEKLNNKYTVGLMERNCYRFLLAIRDFDSEYRQIAKNRFESEDSYYTNTLYLKTLKKAPIDAYRLQKAWNSMK